MATNKLSDSAKNLLRNTRRGLAREEAAHAEARRAAARALLQRQPPKPREDAPVATRKADPRRVAVKNAVVPRCAAVLSSKGIKARIQLNLGAAVTSAWTDMDRIVVDMPFSDTDELVDVISTLRGAVYHEGGHISYTTRFTDLLDQWIEANRELLKNNGYATPWATNKWSWKWAWNCLEDQRMEMMVVEDSPRVARYFVPMVLDIVINERRRTKTEEQARNEWDEIQQTLVIHGVIESPRPFDPTSWERLRVAPYVLICQRRYLSRSLRRSLRREFVGVHGEEFTRNVERIVANYVYARSINEAVQAISEFVPLLDQIMLRNTNHEDKQRRNKPFVPYAGTEEGEDNDGTDADEASEGDEGEGTVQSIGNGQQEGEDDPSQQGDGTGTSGKGDEDTETAEDGQPITGQADGEDVDGEDAAGEQQTSGEGDTSHTDDGQGGTQQSIGTDEADHSVDSLLRKEQERSEEEMADDETIQSDIRAVNELLWSGNCGSGLESIDTGRHEDAAVVARAHNLSQQVVTAFREVTMDAQPTWQEGQRRGVLNVNRWVTRQVGDLECWRSWSDEVAPAVNIAVSVLLDYSGSMSDNCTELSVMAFAMKSACDELGIPCTVSLWDHNAVLLWDGMDRASYVPEIHAAGGTDPRMALEDVPNQRFDKAKHIVLVMTDGQFSSATNWLDEYRTEGSMFLGVVFGRSSSDASMATMGFDRWLSTPTLEPMVRMLEEAIIDMAEV